jgi:protein-S-isoprenylcysteine O-methyltransferase Ste14
LVGSGDRIGVFTLPFIIAGVILNVLYPSVFSVGGPGIALRVASAVALLVGVTVWLWSALLILVRVPRGELITTGPYSLVKHPLYTGVSLLVLPWVGFLVNSWLGAVIGVVMYVASRLFAPAEEAELARAFGGAWDRYRASVRVPWL